MSRCRACQGDGWDTDVQPVCCGKPLSSGECCGQPEAEQIQVPCGKCRGSGRSGDPE